MKFDLPLNKETNIILIVSLCKSKTGFESSIIFRLIKNLLTFWFLHLTFVINTSSVKEAVNFNFRMDVSVFIYFASIFFFSVITNFDFSLVNDASANIQADNSFEIMGALQIMILTKYTARFYLPNVHAKT